MKRMLLPFLPLLLAASPPVPREFATGEKTYPEAARKAGVEGDVRFDLLIDAYGRPRSCTVTAGADLPAGLAAGTCAFAMKSFNIVPFESVQNVPGRRSLSIAWRIKRPCTGIDNNTICFRLVKRRLQGN
jgi:hypothetical protein